MGVRQSRYCSMWAQLSSGMSLCKTRRVIFSIGVMVVLSIFLRQRGSPESEPVDSPHHEIGNA